ncbi:MAG: hypothetical protein ACHQO8_05550 [Vicinamibacterales bacterium]
MKRSWVGVGAVVVVAAGLAFWLARSGGERVSIDLVQEFPNAKTKRPTAEVFSVVDATISGVTRKSIFTKDPSRVAWHFTVPQDAWLRVSLGIQEQGWTMPGDGVVFQIVITDGKASEELLRLRVNPYQEPSDREWKDLTLDLSPHAGESVDLIFNTLASADPAPGQPFKDDRNGDFALWGAPRVVVK